MTHYIPPNSRLLADGTLVRGRRKIRTVTAEQLRIAENQSRRSEIDLTPLTVVIDRGHSGPVRQATSSYEDSAPPRVRTALAKAPRTREIFWCQFPRDAELPEFWKVRPVVVLSRRVDLNGTVFVVPCTSHDQTGSVDAVALSTTIGGSRTWAVCDKPVSVAVSRLRAPKEK